MEKVEVIIEAKAMLQSVTIFHAIFYFLAKLWQILNVSLSGSVNLRGLEGIGFAAVNFGDLGVLLHLELLHVG